MPINSQIKPKTYISHQNIYAVARAHTEIPLLPPLMRPKKPQETKMKNKKKEQTRRAYRQREHEDGEGNRADTERCGQKGRGRVEIGGRIMSDDDNH